MRLLSPLAIFTGPYAVLARWAVIVVLLAAVAGFFWVQGDRHGTRKLIDYQAKEAIATTRIVTARAAAAQQVVTKYVKVKGDTQTVTKTIEKEVVRYANPGFCLDAAWRVRHDAAALNAIPDAGFESDGASGAPKAAEALAVVTSNYAACNRTADRLDALQEWIRSQAAVK